MSGRNGISARMRCRVSARSEGADGAHLENITPPPFLVEYHHGPTTVPFLEIIDL